MILRIFRVRVRQGRAAEFKRMVQEQSIPWLERSDGMLGYFPGEPLDDSSHEFVMVTLWRNVEALKDVVCALPPFDAGTARRLIEGLKLRSLLSTSRTGATPAVDAYCQAAANFSVMVNILAEVLEEIDINPMIVHEHGCIAVDALVVGRAVTGSYDENRRAG